MSISQRRQNVYYLTPFNAFTVAVSSAPNLQSSRARMPRGAVSQLKALGEKRQDAIPNSVSIPLSGDDDALSTFKLVMVATEPLSPIPAHAFNPGAPAGHLAACAIVPHCTAEYPRSCPCPCPCLAVCDLHASPFTVQDKDIGAWGLGTVGKE
jgi:hypothetical protein